MPKKVKILLLVLLLILGLKLYSSAELHFPFNPYIDTIFSKDFSWDKFNAVNVGMSQEEVKGRLGEPLETTSYGNNDPSYTCWIYSKDGKLQPYADFSYYRVQTCFNDGIVVSKSVEEFNKLPWAYAHGISLVQALLVQHLLFLDF